MNFGNMVLGRRGAKRKAACPVWETLSRLYHRSMLTGIGIVQTVLRGNEVRQWSLSIAVRLG